MTKKMKDLIKRQNSMSLFDSGRFGNVFDMMRDFNSIVDKVWNDYDLTGDAFYALQPKASLPKINVAETETAFEVEIATSGIDKDDLELEFKDSCLFIKVNKTEEKEEEDKKWLMREISSRSFRRTIKFPVKIDSGSIESSYDESKGLVRCTLPKISKEEPDVVKIKID